VTARYRPELDRVLIDLNLEVKPREKVGIVGRTGSGKSTLVQLLFRILELEEGSIQIDGIDIFKMGLKSLRTAIAMLPQVRRNCIVQIMPTSRRAAKRSFCCPPISPFILAPGGLRCDSHWIT
jgi:ABC-type transport system involved in cytochrome bd biosynthesis fused ATPase/permease subunit